MIQVGPEVPFPHGSHGGPDDGFVSQEELMQPFKYSEIHVPDEENDHCQDCQFDSYPPFGIISISPDGHDCIYHEEEVGMEWTYVVQNVGVAVCETKEED